MRYRITIRHGRPQAWHVEDVEADSLAGALRHASEHIDIATRPDADLVEIRVQIDPEARHYAGA